MVFYEYHVDFTLESKLVPSPFPLLLFKSSCTYTSRESKVVIQRPHPDGSCADLGSDSIYLCIHLHAQCPMHTCTHTCIYITEHRHLHINLHILSISVIRESSVSETASAK